MKVRYLLDSYEATRTDPAYPDRDTIKWDAELDRYLARGVRKSFDASSIRSAAFRPFCLQWVYFDQHMKNGRRYQLPSLFREVTNPSLTFLGVASTNPLSVFAADKISDLCYLMAGNGGTQMVTRHRYTKTGERQDNITD